MEDFVSALPHGNTLEYLAVTIPIIGDDDNVVVKRFIYVHEPQNQKQRFPMNFGYEVFISEIV